jgi:hypothetical protein
MAVLQSDGVNHTSNLILRVNGNEAASVGINVCIFNDTEIKRDTSGNNGIELGIGNTGNRTSFIDFHSAGNPFTQDFNARISRGGGNDGKFAITNTGTGIIELNTSNSSVNITRGNNSTQSSALGLGSGRTGNGFAHIDLHGDTTFSDWGSRWIRNNTGPNTNTLLAHRGTGILSIQALDTGDVQIATNGVERMRVTSGGAVNIGHNTSGTGAGIIAPIGYRGRSGTGGTFANVFNIAWTGSVANLWIDSTNIGAIQTSSDYRIKKNIQTQTANAIERIKKLRPITYELKNYQNLFAEDGVLREGFIAHEVQQVIPSGAEGEKDEETRVQSLRLDAIVSVLTKALQEAIERIETLENKIELLSS